MSSSQPLAMATRRVTLRDFVIFQIKLALDALKDIFAIKLSLIAVVVDMVTGGGRRPRRTHDPRGRCPAGGWAHGGFAVDPSSLLARTREPTTCATRSFTRTGFQSSDPAVVVQVAERSPAVIIHSGDPLNSNEKGPAKWIERVAPFN